MKMRLTLFGLDTEGGDVDEFSAVMMVESLEEAEDNDAYYEIARQWASDDLGVEVYSFEYYEWDEVDEDEV